MFDFIIPRRLGLKLDINSYQNLIQFSQFIKFDHD